MLEVGSNIPPELYQVVAAIYCQLLQTSKEIRDCLLYTSNLCRKSDVG